MLLLLFFLTSFLFALECPVDTTRVEFESPFSYEKTIFCQKSHQGTLVKHGQEIVLTKDGIIKSTRTFVLGKESTRSNEIKTTTISTEKKKEIKELVHHILFDVLHFSPKRKMNHTLSLGNLIKSAI